MNHDRIRGRWKQFKGKLQEQWGRLTDDDLDVIAGRREQLLGRIQQRHGLAREETGGPLPDAGPARTDHPFDPARDRAGSKNR